MNDVKLRDILIFGAYWQGNGKYGGKQSIEWMVLDKQEDKVLLLSKYGLAFQPFDREWKEVTWDNCSLRQWLNEEFLKDAFSREEQEKILETTVKADANPTFDLYPGKDTRDKVFLLSIREVKKYLKSEMERHCPMTRYAAFEHCGKEYDDEVLSLSVCDWWLRTVGDDGFSASNVEYSGYVDEIGNLVCDGSYLVRPAIWVNFGR